jgi:uncharacterized protein YndB with AHSA1/START domain
MEQKTKISAEDGKQDMIITREFDLPIDLLFRAYTDADIVEQWMGSKVMHMENKKHGGYQLEKKDASGNVIFRAGGVIHDFIQEKKIVRTFEMENTPFGVQLEVLEFESLSEDRSKLNMHVIYESASGRDQIIQFGMKQGMNAAHNRLQDIVGKFVHSNNS